jgi:endonuclease III
MNAGAIRRKVGAVDRALEKAYGKPKRIRRSPPLDALIGTILSQNTNDRNSGRAYAAMREAYPTWEAVMRAPQPKLEEVLRPGGLAKTKSTRIQQLLRGIAKEGPLNLDWLRKLPTEEAEARLLAFDGVGYKTARCVLVFSLGHDSFPIDTHIFRILTRLGLLPAKCTPDRAHQIFPQYIREGRCYPLHLNLIRHGRQVCHARNPACGNCVLRRHCAYYAAQG